jgi:hypothetical protein
LRTWLISIIGQFLRDLKEMAKRFSYYGFNIKTTLLSIASASESREPYEGKEVIFLGISFKKGIPLAEKT